MSWFDRAVSFALPAVPKPVVRLFSRRYIAGSRMEDAFRVVRELKREGAMATLDILGEFVLRTWMESVGIENAEDTAEGWGGDTYVVLQGPSNEMVFVTLVVWDKELDAQEFAIVANELLSHGRGKGHLDITGNKVLMVIAPSEYLISSLCDICIEF